MKLNLRNIQNQTFYAGSAPSSGGATAKRPAISAGMSMALSGSPARLSTQAIVELPVAIRVSPRVSPKL